MRKQTRERVPLWKTPPAKPAFWKKTLSPFLFVLIGFAIWFVLRTVPISSGLKYIAGTLTLVAAVAAFALKSHSEYKKTGQFSPTSAEVIGTSVAVAIALIAICGTWADDKDKSKQSAKEVADKKQQQQYSETQRAREAAIAYGEKTLALQAEHNKREELANARNYALDMKLQEQITQSLTREAAARNRQAQKDATAYLRSVAVDNHVAETTATLKGFQATAQGFRETAIGIERTLNPIQSAAVAYRVQIPLNDPQMEHYRTNLDKAVQAFLKNGKRIDPGSPFTKYETTTFTDPHSVTSVLYIRRGSELYPTDATSLRANLFSYPVEVRFWKRLYRYKSGAIGGPIDRLPELLIRTAADKIPPDVFYDLTHKKLGFKYKGAILPSGSYEILAPNGLSLPDLKGDKVAISQDEMTGHDTTDPSNFDNIANLARLKKKYRVDLIDMEISNKLFVFGFGGNKWTYFDTPNGIASTFTFDDNLTSFQRRLSDLNTTTKRSPIP